MLGRLLVAVLLMLSLIQFVYFVNDYFNNYPKISYVGFNYNIPGAFEKLISNADENIPNTIYIDNKIPFADRYWQFYLIKHHREALQNKTIFFDSSNPRLTQFASQSIILYRFDSVEQQQPMFNLLEKIKEPDSFVSFYLYKN
jgi:hypothetical protein